MEANPGRQLMSSQWYAPSYSFRVLSAAEACTCNSFERPASVTMSFSPCAMSRGVLTFLSCVFIQSGNVKPSSRAVPKRAFRFFMLNGFASPNLCPCEGTRKSNPFRDFTGVSGHSGNNGATIFFINSCTKTGGFTSSETKSMGATSTTPSKKVGLCTHMHAASPPPSETPPAKTFSGLPLPTVSSAGGRKSPTISQTCSVKAHQSGT
mmetsp:Transcript_17362/g.52358  ORF Transcript_17362/g.52358 Transcript_17362/m.52358 type:complete len:208 (+) Transcript_17362:133-756(+)